MNHFKLQSVEINLDEPIRNMVGRINEGADCVHRVFPG